MGVKFLILRWAASWPGQAALEGLCCFQGLSCCQGSRLALRRQPLTVAASRLCFSLSDPQSLMVLGWGEVPGWRESSGTQFHIQNQGWDRWNGLAESAGWEARSRTVVRTGTPVLPWRSPQAVGDTCLSPASQHNPPDAGRCQGCSGATALCHYSMPPRN